MPKQYNQNILRVRRLTHEMIILADEGDRARKDRNCGVLYGMLRDTAYKLMKLAESEISQHKKAGIWTDEDSELVSD